MEKTRVSVESRSCTSCSFSGTTVGQGRTLARVCRKNPPTVTAALLQGPEGLVWNSASSWPGVTETDWCGAWEARLN